MIEEYKTLPLIVLAGPTAVGKTSLSLEIAKKYDCEIISVDSMQVYKGMDIGTAKILPSEMQGINHYLLDIIEPDEPYNAGKFVKDAEEAIAKIMARGRGVLLTGGTGLYYKSLLFGLSEDLPSFPEIRSKLTKIYAVTNNISTLHEVLKKHDPESAKRIHQNDTQRVLRAMEIFIGTGSTLSQLLEKHQQQGGGIRFPNSSLICLERERAELYSRINLRCQIMLESGLEKEVRELMEKGYDQRHNSMRSIGYKHMADYINQKYSYKEMLETMQRDTRRYAKRQLTWFRGMQGFTWIAPERRKEIFTNIERNVEFNQ